MFAVVDSCRCCLMFKESILLPCKQQQPTATKRDTLSLFSCGLTHLALVKSSGVKHVQALKLADLKALWFDGLTRRVETLSDHDHLIKKQIKRAISIQLVYQAQLNLCISTLYSRSYISRD